MVHQYFCATGGGGALQRASPSGAGISHESKKKQVLRQKIFWARIISDNSARETDLNEAAAERTTSFLVANRKADAPPGNVRELENRVKRAAIMAEGKRLTAQDLELAQAAGASHAATLKEAREAVEREMIQQSLRKHAGKITTVAAELGVSRPTLYELMEKLGIAKASEKRAEL